MKEEEYDAITNDCGEGLFEPGETLSCTAPPSLTADGAVEIDGLCCSLADMEL